MNKVRQIIKLYHQGLGKKSIASRLGVSKNTIKEYLRIYSGLRLTQQDLNELTDEQLDLRFNPPVEPKPLERLIQLQSLFPDIEKELRRRGMTLAIQFREYKSKYPEGYGETQFYQHYGRWCRKVKASMHIEHKVGDKVYLDYSGGKLPYVEKETGEIRQAEVFVSILGWSQYAYVEAMRDQTVEEFIAGCENAFIYMGGVPLAAVPDNLKSAVFKANKYEPDLNDNFRAFCDHYGCSIVPARVRKPQDKSHVENMVKLTYQRIFVNLPETASLTLEELNIEIRKHLQVSNDTILTGMDCSRTDRWKIEQPTLQELPESRYEMRKVKQVTVMKNGHIYLTEDKHYYSVPYQLIGEKLKLLYSRSCVELYNKYQLIATHERVRSPHNYTTDPSHRTPQHQFVMQWSDDFFLENARQIAPEVEFYIAQVLAKKKYPEQAYKSCQGILSFVHKVGTERLINACKRAHEFGYYNYKIIDDILRKNLDQQEDEPQVKFMPVHDNIRGSNYYQ